MSPSPVLLLYLATASAAVPQGEPTFPDPVVVPRVRGVRRDGPLSSSVTPTPGEEVVWFLLRVTESAPLTPTHHLLAETGGLSSGHPLSFHITWQPRVFVRTLRHARNGFSPFLQINLHLTPHVQPASPERTESLVTIASPPTVFLGSPVAHLLSAGSCDLEPSDSSFHPANSVTLFRAAAVLLLRSGLRDLPPCGLGQASVSF